MESESQQAERTEADDLLDRIWNAEQVCRSKEAVVRSLKEDLKAAKEELDEAVINLRLLASAKNEDRPLFDGSQGEVVDAESEVAEAVASNWVDYPIETILAKPIAGLGQAKREALIDAVPTLGDLEKLRTQVGRDADHLSKLLPKGIGQATADEIEERHLNFIATSAKGEAKEPAPTTNDLSDEERERVLTARADYLQQTIDEGDDGRFDEDVWQSGYDSGHAGEPLTECIYEAGNNQDDWICGWLTAKQEASEDTVDAADVLSQIDEL